MKAIATDGSVSADVSNSWDFVELFAQKELGAAELYARVAAAYTAVNRISRAMASVPFALVNKQGKDYDVSYNWQNKVEFMPKPGDLLRRVRQSITFSNKGYLRMGKNIAGIPKKLHYVLPTSINPIIKGGELVALERVVGGVTQARYDPDDPDLIRFWWLDFQTELLPTTNTEFQSITNAAGILYACDFFTRSYFTRGGIRPTLIALKGLISTEQGEDLEKSWTKFLRGLGQGWKKFVSSVKLYNAESMTIQPFGDGLGDLKDNPVYRQSIENIALGLDIPLSILLSNSANYATAQIENRQWYETNVVPWFDWHADELNDQLFDEMGLKLVSRPETMKANQEEEVQRSAAAKQMVEFILASPSAEIAFGVASTLGFELTAELQDAIKKHFAVKKQPSGSPSTPQTGETMPNSPQTQDVPATEQQQGSSSGAADGQQVAAGQQQPASKASSVVATLTVLDLEELRIWREVAVRRTKAGKSLVFPYKPHNLPIPNYVAEIVMSRLKDLDGKATPALLDQAFDFSADVQVTGQSADGLGDLVKALNTHAAALFGMKNEA